MLKLAAPLPWYQDALAALLGNWLVQGLVVAAVAVVAGVVFKPFRRLAFRAIGRVLRLRIVSSERVRPKKLPWVEEPRWGLRMFDKKVKGKTVYGLKNVGGAALHVRLRAERDEVELLGKTDWEEFPAAEVQPFHVAALAADGLFETGLYVSCEDANGTAMSPVRLVIPSSFGL